MAMTSDFAFVLGTGRCGSTLVHEVLSRHPDVGFITNVEDRFPLPASMGRWNNDIYRLVPEQLTRKGRLRFAPSEGYRLLDRKVSPMLSTPFRDLMAEDVTPWLSGRTLRLLRRASADPGQAAVPAQVHRLAAVGIPTAHHARGPVRQRDPRWTRGR